MADAGKRQQRISVNRAFVIHFKDGAGAPAGGLAGTVEHVASGERSRFSSWNELKGFMNGVLESVNGPGRDDNG